MEDLVEDIIKEYDLESIEKIGVNKNDIKTFFKQGLEEKDINLIESLIIDFENREKYIKDIINKLKKIKE